MTRIAVRSHSTEAANTLAGHGIHPVLARILAARGVARPDELSTELADLLPPEKKKAVGKDHFFVRQAGNNKDLLDSAPSLVQVVGNSMVQPYLGFPQKLSNAIDNPVGLTWTFGNVGPWKTLLNYLESPAFKSAKIKALVWQFNEGQMMNGPNAATQWDAASIMAEDAWLARLDKALAR